MIKKHADLLIKTKCEKVALLEMRTHTAWYLKGMKGSNSIKQEINGIKTKEELFNILDRLESEQDV